MQAATAPALAPGPRALPLAAVAVLHGVLISLFLYMPSVRERFVMPALVYVDARPSPAPRQEPKPLPPTKIALHTPAPVEVPLPHITLAPEIPVAQAQTAPTITVAAVSAPPEPAAPPSPLVPPRFDMAYLNNPSPSYPAMSRRLHEQGRVILRVLVSEGGTADQVEIRTSSGSERLDQAAIDAVRRWRFAPARQGALAVSAWALVPILFQLDT